MIRVLMVVTSLDCGGIENLLMNIYRLIDRNIIQFDFLTHRGTKFYFEEEVKQLGGKIYRISPVNPFFYSKYCKELNRFFKEHKEYKIVHAHLNTLSSYVLKTAKKNNVPIRIAHSHNCNLGDSFIKRLIKIYSRFILPNYCNYQFACSKEAGDFLFGKKNNNYFTIRNGINVEKYRLDTTLRTQERSKLNINNNIVFGNVGRFTEQKNHMYLLDIFKYINRKNTATKLLLIGDGELSQKIENRIKELNLEKSVILLGMRDDINKLLMVMDVFLFPSKSEGLGIALIEAQASGLQCLASTAIPKEAKVTDLVEFLPLGIDVKIWGEQAIAMAQRKRENTQINKIKEAGYDIADTVAWLQRFYLDVWEAL